MEALQGQLQDLLAKDEMQPFLNPKYESQQAALFQADLSKKLISHLEALAAAKDRKEGTDAESKEGQQVSLPSKNLVMACPTQCVAVDLRAVLHTWAG